MTPIWIVLLCITAIKADNLKSEESQTSEDTSKERHELFLRSLSDWIRNTVNQIENIIVPTTPPPHCECPPVHRPVCGTDGQVYNNFKCMLCANKDLKVIQFGKCNVEKTSQKTSTKTSEDNCHCDETNYQPVCGYDLRTYANEECLLCQNPATWVSHSGECFIPPSAVHALRTNSEQYEEDEKDIEINLKNHTQEQEEDEKENDSNLRNHTQEDDGDEKENDSNLRNHTQEDDGDEKENEPHLRNHTQEDELDEKENEPRLRNHTQEDDVDEKENEPHLRNHTQEDDGDEKENESHLRNHTQEQVGETENESNLINHSQE